MAVSIWPSIIYILATAFIHGWRLPNMDKAGVIGTLIGEALLDLLLYWGGFFDPLFR